MKIRFEPRKKRCGASLVEMVIAIFVLAVVLLGLLGGMTITRANLATVKERETATQVALAILADLESVPYDEIEARIAELEGQEIGGFVVDFYPLVDGPDGPDYSVIVTVDVLLSGARRTKPVTMSREVSASARKNVGEWPKPDA